MKVRDFTKISLQHFAIARQPNPFAVVLHLGVNELLQLSPVLPVQTVDVFTIGGGKSGVDHSCLRGWLHSASRRRRALAVRMGSFAPDMHLIINDQPEASGVFWRSN